MLAADGDRLSLVRHLFEAAGLLGPASPVAPAGRLILATAALVENIDSGDEIVDPEMHFLASGHLVLHFDEGARALRAWLVFEVRREPAAAEVNALVAEVESRLFYTGWGMNLEWELPARLGDDRAIHVDPRVLDRSYTPAP